MAAETLLILGESGQGKSTSLRNLNPKETFIISTTSKPLPWRGWKKNYTKWDPKSNPDGNWYQTAKSSNVVTIIKYVSSKRPEIKNIVLDRQNCRA
jgi:adenylate kinase family enzyme